MNELAKQIDEWYRTTLGKAAIEGISLQEKLIALSKTSRIQQTGMYTYGDVSNAQAAALLLEKYLNLQKQQNELSKEYNDLLITRAKIDPNAGKPGAPSTPVIPITAFDPETIKKDIQAVKESYDTINEMIKAGMTEDVRKYYKDFLAKNGADYKTYLENELARTKEYSEARLVVLGAYVTEINNLNDQQVKDAEENRKKEEAFFKEYNENLDAIAEERKDKDENERRDKLENIKITRQGYNEEIVYIKQQIALEESLGNKYSKRWMQLKKNLLEMNKVATEVLVEAFSTIGDIANSLGELSYAFSGVNDELSKIFSQLSIIASSTASMVKGLTLGTENPLQTLTSAVSLITGVIKLFMDESKDTATEVQGMVGY